MSERVITVIDFECSNTMTYGITNQILTTCVLPFHPQMALRTHKQTWRKLCQQSGQSLPGRTFDPLQSALY